MASQGRVRRPYLIQERSAHDRRIFHVRGSDKGLEICQCLDQLFAGHSERLGAVQFTPENLEQADTTLRRLEQFWASPQHFTNRVTSVA